MQDAHGNDVSLSDYKGKVLLIVNVASKCGMTNSNYAELNQLYDKYKDQGLQVLAFPCNQFGDEEPGSNTEIVDFVCTRFKSEFPIFDKAYFCQQARGTPEIQTEADLMVVPPGFPCPAIRLRRYEARTLAYVLKMKFGGGMTLSERQSICLKECDVVSIKTCREMEGGYYDFFKKHRNQKTILLVGPVVPETPTSTLDDGFDGWLNGFSHGSVVFCALRSECVLENDQFHELVHGLELTGRPFFAALRPPKGSETIESGLPEGFLKRTKGRGIIHGGWVQQQLMLHHPSVGCFITHCGAGSLAEAMSSESQLVLLPQSIDQFLNARLMSTDLRVGVEVNKDEDTGSFTKEAICEAVQTVMDVENEVGKEVRANHTKWRNTLLKPGLEDSYIDEFVKSLQDMLG
ncbi:hypothetical protein RND81_06G242300 [Saponaria officinalis]|uniref:Multifunctional fusion protein n=1 Tax=Saponaria officinalis TaxID=3572 RepID=A0AAW1KF99_SAPOF